MITLRAEHIERLEEMLRNAPAQVNVAAARAINRAAYAARTQAGRSVRETYTVKHKDVISTIRLHKKATPADLNAEIRSRGSTLKLMKFKVTPSSPQPKRKRPIKVSVKKGSNKTIKNGFVARMSNGHMNVFTRTTKKRFPIRGHYGPSVPQMLGNESVTRFVERKANEVLDNRLEHEINRLLRG